MTAPTQLGPFDHERVERAMRRATAERLAVVTDPQSLAELAAWCLEWGVDLLALAQEAGLHGRTDWRRCAWPGCHDPARPRRGNRGPLPR